MNINKKMIAVITVLCAFMISDVIAKVRPIMTRRDFERTIAQENMVIALFYETQKCDTKAMRDQYKGLLRMYEDISRYRSYNDADLVFLKINVCRKDLADLAALYNITAMPTFLFFNNGKQLINDRNMAITAQGFMARTDLQSFIDNLYGDQIKQYVAEKERRKQELIAQENESWKQYFYPRTITVEGYAPAERQRNME